MGLEALSDEDLQAVKSGNLSKVSDAGLLALKTVGAGLEVGKRKAAAAPFDAGGETTDFLSSKGAPPWLAATGGTAANLGVHGLAMLAGGLGGAKVAEKTVTPVMDWGAHKLMQMAIRPMAGDLERGKVQPAIQTMLEQGYNPTNAGVAAMRQKGNEIIAPANAVQDASNKVINTNRSDQNLQALADRLMPGTNGPSNIRLLNEASARMHSHPNVDAAGLLSVPNAQAMKQANYREIGAKGYGENLDTQISRDALKAQTAALRRELEVAHPEIVKPNADAAELFNAANVSQRRALMEGNKDPVPFSAALALAHGNPAVALGLWGNSSAYAKAMAARLLYNTKEVPRAVAGGIGVAAGAPSEQR